MDGQELAGIRLFGATIPIQTPDHASRSQNESNVHNDHHEEDQEEVGINKLLAADLDHDHDNQEQEQEQEHQDQEQRTEESTNRGAAAEKPIQCPRCKSVETKFCYFNNYNVNQPRHFCKGCQRYWTAGGALRNVPVGAGRRKINKPPSSLEEEEVEVEEDWQITAPGLPQVFPVKRRRSTSAGQSC